MRKLVLGVTLVLFLQLIFPAVTYASDYVLPYPSYMPGHKLYRCHQLWEKVQQYWYFGNLAQFKYHLKMADKYLVETKTLFEYDQHWLALQALKNSDFYFQKTSFFLQVAAEEGKDIGQKEAILKAASLKHQEVLTQLLNKLPSKVIWQEEKKTPQPLEIQKLLKEAKTVRGQV